MAHSGDSPGSTHLGDAHGMADLGDTHGMARTGDTGDMTGAATTLQVPIVDMNSPLSYQERAKSFIVQEKEKKGLDQYFVSDDGNARYALKSD